jgi:hypothetical protein
LNASWSLLSAPATSAAVLGTGNDARKSLVADIAGDYVVQVGVGGASNCGDDDDFDDFKSSSQRNPRLATVLISTRGVSPVANAGPEQKIAVGAQVTLDGTKTTDVNGGLLTYRWALLSKPAGSTAALDDPAAVRPKFVADIAGTYVAQLLASDGIYQSRPATVVVSSDITAPVADAGPDVVGKSGTAVALNGGGSNDVGGATLTAKWSILGLGDQLTGNLSNPTSLQTNFNVPTVGVALTQAVLTSPTAMPIASGDDSGDDDGQSLSLKSVGRLSNNGQLNTIWRVRNASSTSKTATLMSPGTTYTVGLTIPARSDLFVASTAVLGTAQHRLLVGTKTIAMVSALSQTFADTRLVGGGPLLKLSIIQLAVSNGLLQSIDDVMVSTVETRPVAVPRGPATSFRGTALQFDGLASRNPNLPATPTAGLTYRWSLLARPTGSAASLSNITTVQPTLVPDAYGLYVAQLIVSDGVLDSRPQTVAIRSMVRRRLIRTAIRSPMPGP